MYYSNDNLLRFTTNVRLHYGNERKMCLKEENNLICPKTSPIFLYMLY